MWMEKKGRKQINKAEVYQECNRPLMDERQNENPGRHIDSNVKADWSCTLEKPLPE